MFPPNHEVDLVLYRLFKLDAQLHVDGAPESFESADDAAAIEQAMTRAHPHAMELWVGERLVILIKPERRGADR